jgi:CO/xanthine dehydrogenase Mo-binding subunit
MTTPAARSTPSLAANPRLGQWLTICADGRVLVRSGKVELGQGVLTALAQIVGEELDVTPGRVHMVAATTGLSPDESYTAGSLSIQHSGGALRQVCAQVRALFLDAAAVRLAVDPAELRTDDGTFCAPDGRSTSYWDLAAEVGLDQDVAPGSTGKGSGAHRTVGTSLPRLDVPDKVAGRRRFLHDQRLPGMLFGRVLRPPSRAAELVAVDDARARAVPGVVAVVRDGAFVGVVAEREENALRALEGLRAGCTWREQDVLPPEDDLAAFLTGSASERVVLRNEQDDEEQDGNGGAGRTVRARFLRPYLAHASIAPSCGIARWQAGRLEVWSHSQGIYNLRTEICRSLQLAAEDVVVQHVEGAGCYGHNAADDAAYDAVLLARAVPGRPVQVVWSRADELSWAPFGPAMLVELEADVDDAGRVRRWRHDVWSNGHSGRPAAQGSPPLLAATHVRQAVATVPSTDPPLENGGGSGRNAVPLYALPQQLVRTHVLQTMPLRTSALRALGAHLNVYAIESVIDELAELAGADPVQYRLDLLPDARARDVLSAAAERAGWGRTPDDGLGRGVAVARYKGTGAYCAVVAEVEAEASVRVTRLTMAVDVGLVVNPDGVVNQIEGGALQAVSWTTKEQVRFGARQVTSQDWEGYPILTFSEAPAVDVVILDRPDQPSLGAGETSLGPTAAAIGNALHAATGLRVRTLPLTPRNIVAAMEDAGP